MNKNGKESSQFFTDKNIVTKRKTMLFACRISNGPPWCRKTIELYFQGSSCLGHVHNPFHPKR
jgi:hypothetical protein